MPWRETSPVQERIRFGRDSQSGLYVRLQVARPLRRQGSFGSRGQEPRTARLPAPHAERRAQYEPAHPEQNGAHERFHRTLKAETGQPVAGNRRAQQRRFDRFREVYNHERPHEALGQAPPDSRCHAAFRRRCPPEPAVRTSETRLRNHQSVPMFPVYSSSMFPTIRAASRRMRATEPVVTQRRDGAGFAPAPFPLPSTALPR
jgi:hypothetical protein